MSLIEILIAILMAVITGTIFYYIFRVSGPWGSFWSFLIVLILVGLAAQAWVTPIGPVIFETSWLSALIVIFFFALLIAAASPPQKRPARPADQQSSTEPVENDREGAVALGIFFWFLLLLLGIAAIWGIAYV